MTAPPRPRVPAALLVAGLGLVLAGCETSKSSAAAEDAGVLLGPRAEPSDFPTTPTRAADGHGWNEAQIELQSYDAGLAKAKAQNKPVCLVVYANWCPHCRNYSKVFDDPRVVERARDFVMVKIDADDDKGPAAKYALDGGYVPRTFFLGTDGAVDPEVHAPRDKFRYFFDERDPASLLAGMDAAKKRLAK